MRHEITDKDDLLRKWGLKARGFPAAVYIPRRSYVGLPDEVKEKFQYYIDMGFNYFQVIFPGLGDDYVDASRRFAEGVKKKL